MIARAQNGKVRLELTEEQKERLRRILGKDVPALELTADQLEERIAPGGLAASVLPTRD